MQVHISKPVWIIMIAPSLLLNQNPFMISCLFFGLLLLVNGFREDYIFKYFRNLGNFQQILTHSFFLIFYIKTIQIQFSDLIKTNTTNILLAKGKLFNEIN